VDHEDGAARIVVDVRRGGERVADAVVSVENDIGGMTLELDADGDYGGTQVGWGQGFFVRVEAGEDYVEGTIAAPGVAELTSPDPTQAFDPHADEDGMIRVAWTGTLADEVSVKTKEFEWSGADTGEVLVPATLFVETSQEIKIRRENWVVLAGGAPGSQLAARSERKADVIVANPY
jgi:hypothetical protein